MREASLQQPALGASSVASAGVSLGSSKRPQRSPARSMSGLAGQIATTACAPAGAAAAIAKQPTIDVPRRNTGR